MERGLRGYICVSVTLNPRMPRRAYVYAPSRGATLGALIRQIRVIRVLRRGKSAFIRVHLRFLIFRAPFCIWNTGAGGFNIIIAINIMRGREGVFCMYPVNPVNPVHPVEKDTHPWF